MLPDVAIDLSQSAVRHVKTNAVWEPALVRFVLVSRGGPLCHADRWGLDLCRCVARLALGGGLEDLQVATSCTYEGAVSVLPGEKTPGRQTGSACVRERVRSVVGVYFNGMGGGVDVRGELCAGVQISSLRSVHIEFGPTKPVAVTSLVSFLPSCLRES